MSLSDAIIEQNIALIERYLKQGVDVNEIDNYGYTPLIEAAIVNNVEIAERLIANGAIVNQQDMAGNTALHWATDNSNLELTTLLLQHQANPNIFNLGAQSPLVKPVLREHKELKNLLYQHGGDLKFAQDFINAKLIAHRFELTGTTYIVDPNNVFIEMELEGFFLEFTLNIIRQSLERYQNNFAARHMRLFFDNLKIITQALAIAAELIRYQQYAMDRQPLYQRIQQLLQNNPLIIPFSYEGHAVGAVKFNQWLAICDRGEMSKKLGSVNIYRITQPNALTPDFYHTIFYEKLSKSFMEKQLYQILGLQKIADLPLSSQITGNCSWANIEALIPTLLFMLALKNQQHNVLDIESEKQAALNFYRHWVEWDKDIALGECVNSFQYSSPAARASKVELLAMIIAQQLKYNEPHDIERAELMMPVLTHPDYSYVIKAYLKVFQQHPDDKTAANFIRLAQLFDLH
ncbi:MAG: ankyrin repeat domain-containing protein [Legionellales bacterium]|nr:ankyrin repeat domain-containing protein [Legionellales bacterium]